MKKFAGLEICRFLCAVAVVVWHYQHFFVQGIWADAVTFAQRTTFPLYYCLAPFYQNGHNAVQVFWGLSGFIFFWKYSERIYTQETTAQEFFILRFSRLYPLHFATLIVVSMLQAIYIYRNAALFIYGFNDVPHFLTQLVLASNWLTRQPLTFNGPIWSISAEILAYLAFFVSVRFVKPGLLPTAAIVVLTKIVLNDHPQAVLMCVHFFFAGGLTQQIVSRLGKRGERLAFWASGPVILIVLLALYVGQPVMPTNILVLTTGLLVFFSLLASANNIDFQQSAWLGDLTYSSYLLHFPVQLSFVLLVDAMGLEREIFLSPIALALFLATTFGLAWLVHHYFEMPMQDAIRRRWLKGNSISERVATPF